MTLRIDDAIDALLTTAGQLAAAETARSENEIAKADYEAALLNSLLGSTNGETNKPHSATSAAAAASKDARTVEYRRERIALEQRVTLARAAHKAAEIRAWVVAHTAGRVEVTL